MSAPLNVLCRLVNGEYALLHFRKHLARDAILYVLSSDGTSCYNFDYFIRFLYQKHFCYPQDFKYLIQVLT